VGARFKSIKWLQRIVLTNDYKANDTYARQQRSESHLKTAAYLGDGATKFPAGKPAVMRGTVLVGLSGLKRVEYWLRPDTGMHGTLDEDDPVWQKAKWLPCRLDPPPDDWAGAFPEGVAAKDVWGFDPATGKPREWPLRYSFAGWSATLDGLAPGMYEFRARAVDLNGFAQPEPRTYQVGKECRRRARRFEVVK
jgi:hypothetical protein